MEIKNKFKKLGVLVGTSALAVSSYAAGPDFSTLSSAADFSSAQTAVLAVFGALAVVGVAIVGGRKIMKVLG
jgi:hypothetical protein